MKLTDLNPHWIGTGSIIFGLSFDCPCCRNQRIAVLFDPPIDPDNWIPKIGPVHGDKQKWSRTGGESFESLTLEPSVNTENSGHWHGFIRNGEIK